MEATGNVLLSLCEYWFQMRAVRAWYWHVRWVSNHM